MSDAGLTARADRGVTVWSVHVRRSRTLDGFWLPLAIDVAETDVEVDSFAGTIAIKTNGEFSRYIVTPTPGAVVRMTTPDGAIFYHAHERTWARVGCWACAGVDDKVCADELSPAHGREVTRYHACERWREAAL